MRRNTRTITVLSEGCLAPKVVKIPNKLMLKDHLNWIFIGYATKETEQTTWIDILGNPFQTIEGWVELWERILGERGNFYKIIRADDGSCSIWREIEDRDTWHNGVR